jgi:hypothetical protein
MAILQVTHSLSGAQGRCRRATRPAISKWHLTKAAIGHWQLAFSQSQGKLKTQTQIRTQIEIHSPLIRVYLRSSAVRVFFAVLFTVPPCLSGAGYFFLSGGRA